MLNAALSASPKPATSVYVKVSLAFGSVVLNVPTVALTPAFSKMNGVGNAISVGAPFPAVTVIVKTFSVNNPP